MSTAPRGSGQNVEMQLHVEPLLLGEPQEALPDEMKDSVGTGSRGSSTTRSPRRSPSPTEEGSGVVVRAQVVDLSGTVSRSLISSGSIRNSDTRGGSLFAGREGSASGVVSAWFSSTTSVFRRYVSFEAKVMAALVFVSAVVLLITTCVVLITAYVNQHPAAIADDSVCRGQSYTASKVGNVGYNLATICVACLFVIWITMRAIRLEKGGLLITVALIVVSLVARATYYAFWVADASKETSPTMNMLCQIVFPLASVIMLAALPLAWRVVHTFGWRHLTKFGADSDALRTMKRYNQLDAAAKFDLYVTMTAFVSIFFFVSNVTLEAYGLAACVFTAAFLLYLNRIVKRHYYVLLYLFYITCALMPAFYIYSVVFALNTNEASSCESTLYRCLGDADIIVYNASMCPDKMSSCYSFADRCGANTTSSNGNETCINASLAIFSSCCSHYGVCLWQAQFVTSEQYMMVLLAVIGVMTRMVTVYIGYRQAQEMDVPSVQELIKRGEKNLRDFSLALPRIAS